MEPYTHPTPTFLLPTRGGKFITWQQFARAQRAPRKTLLQHLLALIWR